MKKLTLVIFAMTTLAVAQQKLPTPVLGAEGHGCPDLWAVHCEPRGGRNLSVDIWAVCMSRLVATIKEPRHGESGEQTATFKPLQLHTSESAGAPSTYRGKDFSLKLWVGSTRLPAENIFGRVEAKLPGREILEDLTCRVTRL